MFIVYFTSVVVLISSFFSTRPPFIEISGFHVTYDELYDSFKARGLVGNNVMALWSYRFNLDQLELFEEEKQEIENLLYPSWPQ